MSASAAAPRTSFFLSSSAVSRPPTWRVRVRVRVRVSRPPIWRVLRGKSLALTRTFTASLTRATENVPLSA